MHLAIDVCAYAVMSSHYHLGFSENDILYGLGDYSVLVDATGRAIVANKHGYIPEDLPNILDRFNLNPNTWLDQLN